MVKTCSSDDDGGITRNELKEIISEYIEKKVAGKNKILIIPPDGTRFHSGAGMITEMIYKKLKENQEIEIDIMPALGTHEPMGKKALKNMFGDIPYENFIRHRWRKDTVKIGEISRDYLAELSEGRFADSIEVKINEKVVMGDYDRIISIGQVQPHVVVGMANYTKNIVVGCGGEEIINKSHYLGAVYGLERLIGRDHSPVRKLYDRIQKNMFSDLPLDYVLTVNRSHINQDRGLSDILGIFIGDDRETFSRAVNLSQQNNINYFDKPIQKFVVYLDPDEFSSTWLGNKAIYRTRLAVADGGEIIIAAPGLKTIGEDEEFDRIIRKYGYINKKKAMKLTEQNEDLQENLAVAAHLIHGSPEGRFKVTYACNPEFSSEIKNVNYNHIPLNQAEDKYEIESLEPGFNEINGEKIYYIENPATGVWVYQERF
ncbi:protein of unknown function [Halarsenatibacter silvermanii]|uniref:LarA-like N-terminal domain-containing protein n=1 Tax=Halarsenatibacter silvermanii TaxID=321763 RepID=A0A1G9SF76_9FIRM|nr:protein of unknown function [Halarsenatibacter silvermanii]